LLASSVHGLVEIRSRQKAGIAGIGSMSESSASGKKLLELGCRKEHLGALCRDLAHRCNEPEHCAENGVCMGGRRCNVSDFFVKFQDFLMLSFVRARARARGANSNKRKGIGVIFGNNMGKTKEEKKFDECILAMLKEDDNGGSD
jgi:hypothetical protein